jgi:hypothetical protein
MLEMLIIGIDFDYSEHCKTPNTIIFVILYFHRATLSLEIITYKSAQLYG